MRVIVYSSTVLSYIHIFVKIATKNILETIVIFFYLLFCLRSITCKNPENVETWPHTLINVFTEVLATTFVLLCVTF